MSRYLQSRAATLRVGDRKVDVGRGDEIPDGADPKQIKALEDMGAIGSTPVPLTAERAELDSVASTDNPREPGTEGVVPGESSSSTATAKPAPDPSTASVADLAAWIAEAKPNATETVDAAKGNPDAAAKLIAAENTAQGGDARSTVIGPLQKIADGS
jgi:hypothetical protein